VKQQHPSLIMVDYTVPDVIHDMVDLYIKHKTPFVMGTTGGNRQQILADVQAADLYAVIAPQMGKQVRNSADHPHAEAHSQHLTKQ
jgi:4-hydroxy-tetrahydrodipicolinate reductase